VHDKASLFARLFRLRRRIGADQQQVASFQGQCWPQALENLRFAPKKTVK
jgi:hypothetical protein